MEVRGMHSYKKRILFKCLRHLVTVLTLKVKLFISSREGIVSSVSELFDCSSKHTLTMHYEEAREYIRTYVKGTMNEKVIDQELVVGDEALIVEIENKLIENAGNM